VLLSPVLMAATPFTDTKPLKGKVALITGASEGIGAGIALSLAKAGCDVCINFSSKVAAAEEVAAKCREEGGGKAILHQTSVAVRKGVEEMFEKILTELGPVDMVINNAVVSKRQSIFDTKFEDFQWCCEIGIYGTFHCFQLGARQMLDAGKKGSIIHIGSPHVLYPAKECVDYNTVKAGQQHLVMTAANELMWKGIRVNVVEPGWTYTQGEVRLYGEEQLEQAAQKMPFGRLAYPEDIGRAIVWMCSDEASYVTGANLKVDGGAFIEVAPSWHNPPRDRPNLK